MKKGLMLFIIMVFINQLIAQNDFMKQSKMVNYEMANTSRVLSQTRLTPWAPKTNQSKIESLTYYILQIIL